MKWLVRLLWLAVLAGVLWWGWRTFFPSDERRIRRLLDDVAETVSVPADGKFVGGVLAADRLKGYFTANAEVAVDVPGEARFNLAGREELAVAYLAARTQYRGLAVEFYDYQVAIAPDHATAVVDFTARAQQTGSRDLQVQELRVLLERSEDGWQIQRVETTRSIRF
jgi:ketosteroid isomerase-like protein